LVDYAQTVRREELTMLPAWISAVVLLVFGSGVLAVAFQGWRKGELPAGARGMHANRPNRIDNPFAFRFFLALYICGGMALSVWGLLVLVGMAPPLALR